VHFTELLVIDSWIFLLYSVLLSLRPGAARTGCVWTANGHASLHRDPIAGFSRL